MEKTPFGRVRVSINGLEIQPTICQLKKNGKSFTVNERVKLSVFLDHNDRTPHTKIICEIEECENSIPAVTETGEKFFSVIMIDHATQLSIGVEGDKKDFIYCNTGKGIMIKTTGFINEKEMVFIVTWRKKGNPNDDTNDTWFASDPNVTE